MIVEFNRPISKPPIYLHNEKTNTTTEKYLYKTLEEVIFVEIKKNEDEDDFLKRITGINLLEV